MSGRARFEDETEVVCPYCYEPQLLVIDPGTVGTLVQDCDVCCKPWQVQVERDEYGALIVDVARAQ